MTGCTEGYHLVYTRHNTKKHIVVVVATHFIAVSNKQEAVINLIDQ
jgi:hypothetical protein